MKAKTLLQTAKSKRFGLRDYDKVAARYADRTKHDKALKDVADIILDDYEEIIGADCHQDWLQLRVHFDDIKEAKATKRGYKTAVNRLMTFVNQKAWEANTRYIKYHIELSDATCAQYATRFYLLNYKRINRAMHNVLLDLIRCA